MEVGKRVLRVDLDGFLKVYYCGRVVTHVLVYETTLYVYSFVS